MSNGTSLDVVPPAPVDVEIFSNAWSAPACTRPGNPAVQPAFAVRTGRTGTSVPNCCAFGLTNRAAPTHPRVVGPLSQLGLDGRRKSESAAVRPAQLSLRVAGPIGRMGWHPQLDDDRSPYAGLAAAFELHPRWCAS